MLDLHDGKHLGIVKIELKSLQSVVQVASLFKRCQNQYQFTMGIAGDIMAGIVMALKHVFLLKLNNSQQTQSESNLF